MRFVNKEVVDVIFADRDSQDRAFAAGFVRGYAWGFAFGAVLASVVLYAVFRG